MIVLSLAGETCLPLFPFSEHYVSTRTVGELRSARSAAPRADAPFFGAWHPRDTKPVVVVCRALHKEYVSYVHSQSDDGLVSGRTSTAVAVFY